MATSSTSGPRRRAVEAATFDEAAVALLAADGLPACEIDFEGGFWMDYDFAPRSARSPRADIALSVHAPLAGSWATPSAARS